mgnify:FL=1
MKNLYYNEEYYPKMTVEDAEQMNKLNSKYGYGISYHTLICLVHMHKKARKNNDLRTMSKIEYRLTDINFHYEVGLLSNGEYDTLLKEIKENW